MIPIYLHLKNGAPVRACWTLQDALEAQANAGGGEIRPVKLDPLWMPVKRYFEYRDYAFPDEVQAFLFLVSEMGELADRMVQGQSCDWVRNNSGGKYSDVRPEQADVLMMLTAMAMAAGACPIELMLEKFKEKGYDPGSAA